MADLIDPTKLKSVAELASELGYNPKYFAQLAAKQRFQAWRIGNTWASTMEIIQAYIRSTPPPGRPKAIVTTIPQKRHSGSTRKIKKSP